MSKVQLRMLSLVLSVMLLTGCAENPKEEAVVSKNDGSFDIGIVQSATEPGNEATIATEPSENLSVTETEPPKEFFQYNSQFMSSDNTVEFTIDLNADISDLPMPVVEVAPHQITTEDAKRVAEVLFGDAVFYEAEPLGMEIFSKSEIQAKINRLLNYQGALGHYDSAVFDSARKMFIEEYTMRMETAPEENPHQLCPWEYRKSSYYYWTTEERSFYKSGKELD